MAKYYGDKETNPKCSFTNRKNKITKPYKTLSFKFRPRKWKVNTNQSQLYFHFTNINEQKVKREMEWKKNRKPKEKNKNVYTGVTTPKPLGINLIKMCKFSTQRTLKCYSEKLKI